MPSPRQPEHHPSQNLLLAHFFHRKVFVLAGRLSCQVFACPPSSFELSSQLFKASSHLLILATYAPFYNISQSITSCHLLK